MHRKILKSLSKSEKEDTHLIHYSPKQGLKTITTDNHGSNVRTTGERAAPEHKLAFYYKENTTPEDVVTSGAKSKYVVKQPSHFRVYDLGEDRDNIRQKVKEAADKKAINPGAFTNDDIHAALKSHGYQGFSNSLSALPNAIAMFHELPVHEEHQLHPSDFTIASKTNHNKSPESKKHPSAYEWHDGHTDHHGPSDDLKKDEKPKAEPFVHSQAHGPTLQEDKKPEFEPNTQVGDVSEKSFHNVMSGFGKIDKAKPSNLKFYHGIEHHADDVHDMMKEHGFQHYYAGGKYGKPDLANKNYNTKHLMVYDPTPSSGGDFGDEKYTDTWRKSHELAHALTLNDINDKYGEGRRLGRLGVRTPKEMKRAVHWEWLAAHKQRDLMEKAGYKISDEDFHRELNTVIGDATHRAITGKFTEPSEAGFHPHSHKVPLEHALDMITNHAHELGLTHDDDTLADLHRRKKEGFRKSENDLQKGSLQRKIPFDPKSVPAEDRLNVEGWMDGSSNTKGTRLFPRKNVPELTDVNARKRALNKLHKLTEVRRHPETGERMFLMHRGHSDKEKSHRGQTSSWSPNYSIAENFAIQYNGTRDNVKSAWIPESQIHHVPSSIGSTNHLMPNYEHTPKQAREKGAEQIKNKQIKRSNLWDEHEVIVKPHKFIKAKYSHKDTIDNSIDDRINHREDLKKLGQKYPNNPNITHMVEDFNRGLKDKPRPARATETGFSAPKKPATPKTDTPPTVQKTLEAGSTNAAPSTLTGGAALQIETLSNDLQKPFKSKAQRRFAYANPSKFGGKKGIKEWESKTPENIPSKVNKGEEKITKEKVTVPTKEMVKEHKRLVGVLRSPSHKDNKVEAKKQNKELQEYKEAKVEKSEFLRRGVLLAGIGAGAQMIHNQNIEEAKPIRREIASVSAEKPLPTEPEKAYNAAQKDAFSIAAKHLPLSRNLARKAIKESPELSEAHGYLMHLSPSAYKEVVDSNPKIKQDIASYHYDKLHELHGGDQKKIFDSYRDSAKNIKKPTISSNLDKPELPVK